MTPKTDDPPAFQQAVFDGRVQFHNNLSELLKSYQQACAMRDLMGAYRFLHLAYNAICPYITPEADKGLHEKLFKLRDKVTSLFFYQGQSPAVRLRNEIVIDRMSLEVEEEIRRAGRRLFLPLAEGHGGDFDLEEFLRQSNLTSGGG